MAKPTSKKHRKEINKVLTPAVDPNFELIFLLQDVTDPVNVGALFRLADGCSAQEIIMTGATPTPPNPGLGMTARGFERRIAWEYFPTCEEAITALKDQGFTIIGIELAEGAKNYKDIQYPTKTCLLLGNEAAGIYKKILPLCDDIAFIPMLGKGPSLNVHVATAVVAYEALSQHL